MIKIGFFTGARSEYGVMKKLILSCLSDQRFEVKVFVTGLHLLESFGNTYKEILNDGLQIHKIIPAYKEKPQEKVHDLTAIINAVYKEVKNEDIDCGYIVGDRIEAYGFALSLHFCNIPVIHYAGGQITKGAVDNIYRYNISNLAFLHMVTTKKAFERLKKIPMINSENVYYSGSTAIGAIYDFQNNDISVHSLDENLPDKDFVLITFHPVTKKNENIPLIMDYIISYLVEKERHVLITYPNNDDGFLDILEVIYKWEKNKLVYVRKNLGSLLYYAVLKNCRYVIGNSSSGFIEVPYFNKLTFNIGSRQEGRDKDNSVLNVSTNINEIKNELEKIEKNEINLKKNEYLYGSGNAIQIIKKAIIDNLKNKTKEQK